MAQIREKPEAGEEGAARPRTTRWSNAGEKKKRGAADKGFVSHTSEGHEAVARRPAPHGGGRRERPYGEAVREGRGQDRSSGRRRAAASCVPRIS